MRRFLREQSLSLVFLALFVAALCGQAVAGWHDYNNLETWHAQMAGETPETLSLGRYITSSSFAQAVTENWQSEYLQFTLFILFTVWFVQKGSPESKEPGKEGGESDEEQLVGAHAQEDSPRWARTGGLPRTLYSNSLVLVMAHHLDLVLVRTVRLGLERVQRGADRARAGPAVLAAVPRARRTSGRRRSRTGNRSSSP